MFPETLTQPVRNQLSRVTRNLNWLHISPPVSMAFLCCTVLVLLCFFDSASATFIADMDYGGVPLWINRLLGEPSVLSLQGRMDSAWFRANNHQACPQQCDCPIQWPTALYCDHRGLADIPDRLPDRTQYLFLQLQTDTLDQAALQNQTQLCYFFANHNRLSSVPSALPVGLKQLRLAYNQISSISRGAFRNMHNLTLLLLQGNRLQTIKEGDLKGGVMCHFLSL
ncbi:keratocan-like isoform X2 [Micropterus dolomieu]|uniref:keratocan-like isoform X2 n=1 Tax=Micropterus dolomieu TaxID=147949 RepID=UPI001E8EC025|nr:keratocan-like isoform X2 [Micropterus dolomieu]